MTDHYILDGRKAVRADFMTWARWLEKADRRVAATHNDHVRVSTVFLGRDHSFGSGPPLLFETMIFGGEHDAYQERCTTWKQAEKMHKKACALAYGNSQEVTTAK